MDSHPSVFGMMKMKMNRKPGWSPDESNIRHSVPALFWQTRQISTIADRILGIYWSQLIRRQERLAQNHSPTTQYQREERQ
jgi:hypothetical protein